MKFKMMVAAAALILGSASVASADTYDFTYQFSSAAWLVGASPAGAFVDVQVQGTALSGNLIEATSVSSVSIYADSTMSDLLFSELDNSFSLGNQGYYNPADASAQVGDFSLDGTSNDFLITGSNVTFSAASGSNTNQSTYATWTPDGTWNGDTSPWMADETGAPVTNAPQGVWSGTDLGGGYIAIPEISSTPELSTSTMLAFAGLGLGFFGWRRREMAA